jgi:Ca2+:H+ antiporter
VIAGLGWYIGWPFGKYVEGEGLRGAKNADGEALDVFDDEGHAAYYHAPASSSDQSDSEGTIRGSPGLPDRDEEAADRVMPLPDRTRRGTESDDNDDVSSHATLRNVTSTEREPLLPKRANVVFAGDGTTSKGKARSPEGDRPPNGYGSLISRKDRRSSLSQEFLTGVRSPLTVWLVLGRIAFWPLFLLVLAPVMLAVCILCWGGIISIPMAKLLWALLKLLWSRPLELGFKPAPTVVLPEPAESDEASVDTAAFIKRERLRAGQVAPTGGPTSTVLLCTYKAVGTQYFKYTIGGVNILFVNLLPLVFFVIFDAFVLLPLSEKHDLGRLLNLLANRGFIFLLSLASVIPLSYFIGMAVASISAQSSIGMGAVINATFGSIIEIILYSIALTQGKGRLVEGSLVGSLLAGVLVMPGMSMLSGAFRRKEQSFNAKSAGVTSTMLIMAILGILTPTVFYQAYGSVRPLSLPIAAAGPDAPALTLF